ncbi:hypothetical protein LDENG_00059490 [Lucifuga dentata]|nr:hypothetical protein LDENG_00059490 [Lucifuga dentata]
MITNTDPVPPLTPTPTTAIFNPPPASLFPAASPGETDVDVRPQVSTSLDPLQFVYLPKVGVEDVIIYYFSEPAVTWTKQHRRTAGDVLSPLLFTLYTSDFQYNSESCHLQKCSDDSAVVGYVSDRQVTEYRELVLCHGVGTTTSS